MVRLRTMVMVRLEIKFEKKNILRFFDFLLSVSYLVTDNNSDFHLEVSRFYGIKTPKDKNLGNYL